MIDQNTCDEVQDDAVEIIVEPQKKPEYPENDVKEPAIPAQPKRIYAHQMEIDSDLFKLEIANMKKNTSFDDKNPMLVDVAHNHFFRTYDSNGKKMDRCSSVGGHNHDVKISIDTNGILIGECGPALNTKFGDNHVHSVSYLRSDKVKKRIMEKEAMQFISKMESYK